MKLRLGIGATIGLLALAAGSASAQSAGGLAERFKKSLKDTKVHPSWVYNDLAAGFAAAKRTRKPLLVVFR